VNRSAALIVLTLGAATHLADPLRKETHTAALAPSPQTLPPTPALAVKALLELYDRGDYATVTEQLQAVTSQQALIRLDAELKDRAKAWIDAVDLSDRDRRAFIAGTVALEVTHALVERHSWRDVWVGPAPNPDALPHIHRLIADRAGPPGAIEHHWTLAQLATWQQWNRWARLVGGDLWITPEPVWALLLGRPSLFQLSRTQLSFGREGYLGEALARFPADTRLLLARVEGYESIETRCAREFCRDEMTPAVIENLRSRARGRTGADREMAVSNLASFERLVPVAEEFAALATAQPEVRAEANLHIGYLAIRAGRPDAALTPLTTAATSEDPHVRYLSAYFTGRALTALGRRADALASYRQALTVVPNAPSAATLLAALLVQSDDGDERLEAANTLRSAHTASPPPDDPWDWYWYGDARLWPVYMGRLRDALRR